MLLFHEHAMHEHGKKWRYAHTQKLAPHDGTSVGQHQTGWCPAGSHHQGEIRLAHKCALHIYDRMGCTSCGGNGATQWHQHWAPPTWWVPNKSIWGNTLVSQACNARTQKRVASCPYAKVGTTQQHQCWATPNWWVSSRIIPPWGNPFGP